MPTLATWGGNSNFSYTGSVTKGTVITYGNGRHITVTADDYDKLLKRFRKTTVPVGSSRTVPSINSLGLWLQHNVTKTAIACYVASILGHEGHAGRDVKCSSNICVK